MALTPKQIDGLKEAFGKIAQPINDWLLQDAARRIRQAAEYAGEPGGKMTRTVAYELWRAKAMGESEREMKVFLRRQLKLSNKEIRRLFRQAARFSRDNDEERVGLTGGADLEQMTAAAVKLAQKDFTNLTQTLGMVGRNGKAQPLQKFYQETMDFAFEQVFTGAADYETAMRQATQKMADAGVRTIDYASGRSTSLEAAVRRNLMGGMGLLDEQITQANHDALGCNGWEITAHRNSAPDHEPYQGKQFSDAEWEKLNGTKEKPGILKRRIETLNCKHHPMPIILGVNAPQYTDAELAAMREENAKGITYEGRHYTGYEATQKQRQIERNMRMQKNRILMSEQLEDKAKKQTAQIRLQMLSQHYKAFSKAAGLPLQEERTWVAGYKKIGNIKAAESRDGKTITEITEKRIEKVPVVLVPGMSDEQCVMLRDLHRELLREARDKNENKEVAYVLSNDFQRRQTVYGSGSEIEFSYAPFGKNQFLLHNHPRNHSFSMTDIVTFLREDNLSVMTIVKNNGDVELLTKGENYDKVKTAQELDRRRKKIKQKTDSNYDKMIIRFLTDMNEKDKIIWMKK